MLRPVQSHVAGWVSRPWADASLRFGTMRANVSFGADSWQAEPGRPRVVELDRDLVPWLRSFMDDAERTLRAHRKAIASVATAWELARLHLIFREWDVAAEAAMRSVELIESTGMRVDDLAEGRRLIDQLDEFDCRDVAAALRAALAD